MSSIKDGSGGDDSRGTDKSRRKVLKALAGLPVLGALGFQVFRKSEYDLKNNLRREILKELGLEDLPDSVKPISRINGNDVIRIGIAGMGSRGTQLARALGFMEKERFERSSLNKSLQAQIHSGNLNVAITGICDVFDTHAERGMAIAAHDIFTGGTIAEKHPVKRYLSFAEMLADKNIDAVIIATPDHHHASMTIEAAIAGKHVYCEKALIHREEEIEPVYRAVKESNRVFQLGHQYYQNAVFQQAKEILRRGLLGKISHLETSSNRNTSKGAWIRHLDSKGNLKPGDEKSIDWKQWLGKSPGVPFSVKRFYSWARYFDYDTGLYGQLFSHEYDAVNQLLDIGIPETVVASGGQYTYKDFGEIPDVLHTSFEYPGKELTLTYSANLASSKHRPRTLYGKDASMTIDDSLTVKPDGSSERYEGLLNSGVIDPSAPMIEIRRGTEIEEAVDAISSATSRYYSSRGLTSTVIDGLEWDVTHLHLREWIHCIRNGGTPSSDIEKAYAESVAIAMADISYREKCITKWDPDQRKILRV